MWVLYHTKGKLCKPHVDVCPDIRECFFFFFPQPQSEAVFYLGLGFKILHQNSLHSVSARAILQHGFLNKSCSQSLLEIPPSLAANGTWDGRIW